MITLKYVKYTNFLSTGNYFTEIDLQEAKTTLICGENGSGKSTVMDAICFGLFGKPFRKANKPELINSITNKNMLVEVSFSTESGHYLIRRGMKPAVFEIISNGKMIDQSADQRDYQKVLEQNILKIDFKTFIQKVVIGPANFTPFMQLPAAARRQFIEDLLDIQVFSIMNVLLKTDSQTTKDEIQEVDYQAKILEKTIGIYKDHNEKVQKYNDSIIEAKKAQAQVYADESKELATILDGVNAKKAKAEIAKEKRDDIVKRIADLYKQQAFATVESEKIERELRFFRDNDQCLVCKQKITEEHKQHMLGDSAPRPIIFKLKSLADAIREAEKELEPFNTLDKIIRGIESKISDITSQINLNSRSIQNLMDEISKIKEIKNEIKSYDVEETELVGLNKAKQQLLNKREVQSVALNLLKDSGIKANIIRQYIPIINKTINKYLDMMDFFCHFEVDENFDEKIKARHRDESSYEAFSEGEKMRIDLALMFTWRDIAKLRNSSAVNILILDEIMDASLDIEGTDKFLKIIRKLAKNNNIIIISHKADQIAQRFDRVIHFEKTKNFGKIKEAV